ncbi:hypothetical protein Q5H93_22620 [Hymenobacter sp. ASUV-10]|uniref:Lipoprotein n=1 Tax=Hymenobacter aranciens TaxID=3063996 RepID=A0ABT9BH08_9BACT|nr:hypothetical protein [Hymenobacter sp. ASUV-10]MDO7877550.1 hypothetical protein [Hymenobacter sp. ASUV-10]
MLKLLSFLSPLLAAATGCGDCTPVNLTPDERAWISMYRPGQQLTFRSNRGSTNRMTVEPLKEFHDNQNCNVLESGRFQPIRSTLALTSATNYGGEQSPSFSLYLYKTTPDRPAQFNWNFAGLILKGSDLKTGKPYNAITQPLTLANGRSFPNAQLLRDGQNAMYMRGSQIRAAYWDQKAGLLRYELANGEVFDLQ